MNYEKLNDAMCKLRQAEEDLNKLRCSVAAATNEVDRKPQKFQESNDEEYRKGLKDLYEAFRIIAAEDGMTASDLKDTFGICSVCNIILGFTPEEIIDKTLEWKTKQKKEIKEDQELHVGDEIEYTFPGREPETCIVIGLDNGIENEKIIWTIGLDLSQRSWFSSNCYWGDMYYKTGKHYDSIPLKKEENK